MKTKEEKELTIEQETTRDCPILFQMRYRPCDETCMCWGFECNEGWYNIIDKYSRQMEMLNMQYYSKYRVRIQADQIKEKFGELRFYYSVVVDPNCFVTWIGHKCQNIADYFSNYEKFDYALKKIVDVEPFDYDDTKELTKEEFEKLKNEKFKCSNVDYDEKDGKYLQVTHFRNYGKCHYIPTKHKIAWKMKKLFEKMQCYFLCRFPKKDNAEVRNCVKYMDSIAEELVRKAEIECSNTCEKCGEQIGTDWSPVCTTRGWIKNICDRCAEEMDKDYYKNGELWHGNKMMKSKEEVEKEQSKYEKQ